jgi:hypothetical protein
MCIILLSGSIGSNNLVSDGFWLRVRTNCNVIMIKSASRFSEKFVAYTGLGPVSTPGKV